MNDDNAEHYCEHSDQFHMALDLTAGRRGLQALGEVIARWIAHLLAVEVDGRAADRAARREVHLVCRARRRGTRIGDALWNGEELDEAARGRVVGLFRLTFRDPDVVLDKVGASRSI